MEHMKSATGLDAARVAANMFTDLTVGSPTADGNVRITRTNWNTFTSETVFKGMSDKAIEFVSQYIKEQK